MNMGHLRAIRFSLEGDDLLAPHSVGRIMRGWWELLGCRRDWTVAGMVWCVVDAVWH